MNPKSVEQSTKLWLLKFSVSEHTDTVLRFVKMNMGFKNKVASYLWFWNVKEFLEDLK